MQLFISVNRNNQNAGISTSSGEISIGATSIKQAEITLNHEIAHRILHKEGLNELSLTGEIDKYSNYINRPDEKAIREMDKSKLTHKNSNTFNNFVKSLKNYKNEFLIEAILEGYNYIFESNNLKQIENQAKKYKSAADFVKSWGEPLFHGTKDRKMTEFDLEYDYETHNTRTDVGQIRDYEVPYGKIFLTNNPDEAKAYGHNILRVYLKGKPKIKVVKTDYVPSSRYFDDEYNDGNLETIDNYEVWKFVDNSGRATYLVNPYDVITQPQLINIWNKAHEQSARGINEAAENDDALLAEARI